jgi:hypothetical protein
MVSFVLEEYGYVCLIAKLVFLLPLGEDEGEGEGEENEQKGMKKRTDRRGRGRGCREGEEDWRRRKTKLKF